MYIVHMYLYEDRTPILPTQYCYYLIYMSSYMYYVHMYIVLYMYKFTVCNNTQDSYFYVLCMYSLVANVAREYE